MLQFIKHMFGSRINIAELVAKGATILDVRTPAEYAGGHVKGSINIPLDRLSGNLQKLKDRDHPIITCCASGMRSGSAMHLLKNNGFTEVYNGGSWYAVDRYCNQGA